MECAIPCLNQESKWSESQKIRYRKILKKADVVHYVSKNKYTKHCMNNRNNYMVTKSDVIIAVWNGLPSGTGNTIRMAREQGKKIKIINTKNPNK